MATVPETIAEALTKVQAYFDEVSGKADLATQNLESFALKDPPWVDFGTKTPISSVLSDKVNADDIAPLVRADMKLDLSLFDPDKYKSHVYVSEFFDYLEPKLQGFIEDGGTGISDVVQTSIFDNHRRRKEQIRDDELLAATANAGKMGFPLPTDMVQAARSVVFTRYADQDYNTTLELTALIAERAQQNVQHAIDAGIRMESIQSEFTRFFHQAYTEYARQILDKFKVEQDANVQQLKSDIDIVSLALRADEINASLSQKDVDQRIQLWKFEVDSSIEKTKALISQSEDSYRLQLQASSNLTEYYRTIVAGVAGQVNTLTMASDSTSG